MIKTYSDASLLRCGLELQALEAVKRLTSSSGTATGQQDPAWEVVMEKKDFRVWRRPIPDCHLYEYRGKPKMTFLFCEFVLLVVVI